MNKIEMLSGDPGFFARCDALTDMERQAPALSVADIFIRSGVEMVLDWERWSDGGRVRGRGEYISKQKQLGMGLSAITVGASVRQIHDSIISGEFDPSFFVGDINRRLFGSHWRIMDQEWFATLGTEKLGRTQLLEMAQEADIDPTFATHLQNPRLLPRLFNKLFNETNINRYVAPALDRYQDLAWQVAYPRTTEFANKGDQAKFLEGIDDIIWNTEDRIDDKVYEQYQYEEQVRQSSIGWSQDDGSRRVFLIRDGKYTEPSLSGF